jgi:hypothetical protein
MMAPTKRRLVRLISPLLLGVIVPVGSSAIFLKLGVISYLAPIPSGLALGLLLFSHKSLEVHAVRVMLLGIFAGSLLVIIYLLALPHDMSLPHIALLAVAIFFGIGPLMSIGVEWLRKRKGAA